MGDGYPNAPGSSGGVPPSAVEKGESGIARFIVTAGLVMTVVWLGGGFTASAESNTTLYNHHRYDAVVLHDKPRDRRGLTITKDFHETRPQEP
jgi:hypothetical protein